MAPFGAAWRTPAPREGNAARDACASLPKTGKRLGVRTPNSNGTTNWPMQQGLSQLMIKHELYGGVVFEPFKSRRHPQGTHGGRMQRAPGLCVK